MTEKQKQYYKERMQFLDEHNLCHKCGHNKKFNNHQFCAECIEKYTLRNIDNYNPEYAHNYQQRRREIYQEKKVKGICVRCTNPATHGMYCWDCYIKTKRNNSKKAQKAKNARHDRGLITDYRRENNLCWFCGKTVEQPKIHGLCCNKCAERCSTNATNQENNYFRKTNDLMYGKFGKYNLENYSECFVGTRTR